MTLEVRRLLSLVQHEFDAPPEPDADRKIVGRLLVIRCPLGIPREPDEQLAFVRIQVDVDSPAPTFWSDRHRWPQDASARRSNAGNIGVKRWYGDSVMLVAGRATTVMRASVSRT
jgi:hypothetical protein